MESTENKKATSGSNPAGSQFNIEFWMPEKFELKMVNASTLTDYELWVGITSVLCNFLVGFVVAAITYSPQLDGDSKIIPASQYAQSLLWVVTAIFALFVIGAASVAYKKRKTMNLKAKKLDYVATVVTENMRQVPPNIADEST